jgi:flagellar biosynthesis protein FlhG
MVSQPTDQADGLREQVRAAKFPLRILAVTSGKGGVGKTNLSTNLAVLAARRGRRVLLIDADLALSNVEILYGIKPRYHLGDLLSADHELVDVLAEGPHGIMVLPATSGNQELTQLTDAQKLQLVSALDPLEDKTDLVIMDTAAGLGDNVLFFAGAAQEVVLVVTPEPTSLTDAYATVKVLSQRAGCSQFRIIVNQAANENQGRQVFQRLSGVTSKFLRSDVRYLGMVPRDEAVPRALAVQKPFVDLFPTAPATKALEGVYERLIQEPTKANTEGGLKFLWQAMLREDTAREAQS